MDPYPYGRSFEDIGVRLEKDWKEWDAERMREHMASEHQHHDSALQGASHRELQGMHRESHAGSGKHDAVDAQSRRGDVIPHTHKTVAVSPEAPST